MNLSELVDATEPSKNPIFVVADRTARSPLFVLDTGGRSARVWPVLEVNIEFRFTHWACKGEPICLDPSCEVIVVDLNI